MNQNKPNSNSDPAVIGSKSTTRCKKMRVYENHIAAAKSLKM